MALLGKGDFVAAETLARDVQRSHPDHADANNILGVVLINYSLPNGIDLDPHAVTPSTWAGATRWILAELRPLGALLLAVVTAIWLLMEPRLRRGAQTHSRDVTPNSPY